MDISQAAEVASREDDGQLVQIRDANGDPAFENGAPVTVRIAGTYSKVYRRTQDAIHQRLLKRRSMTVTPEQLTAHRIELVAASILGWEGFTDGGRPFPHTRDNATTLLTKAPWIREQLEEAQADHAGFSPGSSVTSSPGSGTTPDSR